MVTARGWEEVTMRALATSLGIQAPSLYKHVSSRSELRVALVEVALAEMGSALRTPTSGEDPALGAVGRLLGRYRAKASAEPALYRLATDGPLPREALMPGLEDWAGAPFLEATADPFRAQALWAAVHGLVILEIDGRLPSVPAPEQTWTALREAFGG